MRSGLGSLFTVREDRAVADDSDRGRREAAALAGDPLERAIHCDHVIGRPKAGPLEQAEGSVGEPAAPSVPDLVQLGRQIPLVKYERLAEHLERCCDGKVDVRRSAHLDGVDPAGGQQLEREEGGHDPGVSVLPDEAELARGLGGGPVLMDSHPRVISVPRVAPADHAHAVTRRQQGGSLFLETVVTVEGDILDDEKDVPPAT